jgi:hypothetical protein
MLVPTMQELLAVLQEAGVSFRVDKDAPSIDACVRDARQANDDDVMVVLVSKRAFQAYDDDHPERIMAILVKPDRYLVVPLNRSKVTAGDVRHFLETTPEAPKECGVCFRPARTRRGKPVFFMQCCHCHFTTCVDCVARISDTDVFDVEAPFQCPQCRRWTLSGDAYCTPAEELLDTSQELNGDGGLEALVDLVHRLDGTAMILPRVGDSLLVEVAQMFGRRAFSTAYTSESRKRRDVLRDLRKLLKSAHGAMKLYVIRETWHVVDGKPLVEVALFRIGKEGVLKQLPRDAFGLTPVEDMFPQSLVRAIELTAPVRSEVPSYFTEMLSQIHCMHACMTTVSMVPSSKRHLSCSFDMDETGTITTIHPALLAEFIAEHLEEKDTLIVNARMFVKGPDVRSVKMCAFNMDDAGFVRLQPEIVKKLWNDNIDNLKGAARVSKFV